MFHLHHPDLKLTLLENTSNNVKERTFTADDFKQVKLFVA